MPGAVGALARLAAFGARFGLAAPPESPTTTTTTTTTTILPFQGSYAQPKVAERVYGGHASAMGPPPEAASAKGQPSPVQFEEVRGLTEKTFGGGRTKDHLLESGGSGIALLDYDNDGLLDIYAVSAFELDDRRQRIPHLNALYRNLGNWTFKNVAREAGGESAD